MHHLSRPALAGAAIVAALAAAVPATAGAQQSAAAKKQARQQAALIELAHSDGLRAFVRAVSDPRSPRYREYSTPNALQRRFGATPKAKAKTRAFLAEHGLTGKLTPSGQHVVVRGDAAVLRDAFDAERTTTARATGGEQRGWTAQVPGELAGDVTGVSLLADDGPQLQPAAAAHRQAPTPPPDLGSGRARTGTPSGCAEGQSTADDLGIAAFTPNQYLDAYGLSTLHERGITGKGQRIALIEIDGFAASDVQAFATCFGMKVPKIAVHPVGQPKPDGPGLETTLDLQVLTAAVPGIDGIDVYEGSGSVPGVLESVATAIGAKQRPTVMSISLDSCEPNFLRDQVLWARAVDAIFAVAAGSGISTFVATGDQGSTPCTIGNVQQQPVPVFSATFPSSSPHVTAVGGTNLSLDAQNRITDQVVWNDAPATWGATAGGESLVFARPWYQTAVAPRGFDADSHRITPDIAALADEVPGYAIFCTPCGGGWTPVGGTSAATPLMAGATALVNEAAARKGQPALGLINPLVYEIGGSKAEAAKVLWDVTKGSNDVGVLSTPPVSSGEPFGCCSASKGYDAVSGWGSLNVPAFERAAARAARG